MLDVPEWDEWQAMGVQLQGLAKSVHWLVGDWLNVGEREYGEKYAQAVDATGYSVQTLTNDKYVTAQIEIYRRRENLSFAHHAEVARFPAEIQDYWLTRAEEEGWSRDELRKAIRESMKEPEEEKEKRISMTVEQVAKLAASIEVALDRAPELQEVWEWLDGLLREEE
jgi:hypothetical protein